MQQEIDSQIINYLEYCPEKTVHPLQSIPLFRTFRTNGNTLVHDEILRKMTESITKSMRKYGITPSQNCLQKVKQKLGDSDSFYISILNVSSENIFG